MEKNTSASTQHIIDPETPDVAPRPPAPLPEPVNVSSDKDYDDPDELQWPSPYDEIRARFNPPALPPARKSSTTSTQIIPRSVSCPTSYPEKRREIESCGYPQPPVSQIGTTSTAGVNTKLPKAGSSSSSTDSEVPDVPEKKRASQVIPPPPISEQRKTCKDKPVISIFDTKALSHGPFPLAANEKGEHQFYNLHSPRPEPKSPSDTHLMPPIAEAMEQSNSNRPGLPQRVSCDSITLDPHGYIKFITSKGERLSEDQPVSPASDTNIVPDGPTLNSPVHEPRDPSDTSLIPPTAEATEQCVSDKPGLPQRESCDSIALDPQGYVKCISQSASPDAV